RPRTSAANCLAVTGRQLPSDRRWNRTRSLFARSSANTTSASWESGATVIVAGIAWTRIVHLLERRGPTRPASASCDTRRRVRGGEEQPISTIPPGGQARKSTRRTPDIHRTNQQTHPSPYALALVLGGRSTDGNPNDRRHRFNSWRGWGEGQNWLLPRGGPGGREGGGGGG